MAFAMSEVLLWFPGLASIGPLNKEELPLASSTRLSFVAHDCLDSPFHLVPGDSGVMNKDVVVVKHPPCRAPVGA